MSEALITFLRARLDEDEQIARLGISGQEDWEEGWDAYRPDGQRHTTIVPHVGIIHEAVQAEHVARWNPARVLREVAAKRRIVDSYAEVAEFYQPDPAERYEIADGNAAALHDTVYASHPGYRREWTP